MPDPRQRIPTDDPPDGHPVDALGTPRGGSYLVFRMRGREYALPAGAVRGMVELRGAESRVLAQGAGGERVALVDGRAVPLVDLHALLRMRPQPVSARTCLVLAADPEDAIRPSFAFIADSISRIEKVHARDYRADSPDEWIEAFIKLGEKWRGVLNLSRMAQCRGSRAA